MYSHGRAILVKNVVGQEFNQSIDEPLWFSFVDECGGIRSDILWKPFQLRQDENWSIRILGIELLRKIRSARAHVRLIILTDRFTPGDVISAMREGAFSYFSAPFDASELAAMVRAVNFA